MKQKQFDKAVYLMIEELEKDIYRSMREEEDIANDIADLMLKPINEGIGATATQLTQASMKILMTATEDLLESADVDGKSLTKYQRHKSALAAVFGITLKLIDKRIEKEKAREQ